MRLAESTLLASFVILSLPRCLRRVRLPLAISICVHRQFANAHKVSVLYISLRDYLNLVHCCRASPGVQALKAARPRTRCRAFCQPRLLAEPQQLQNEAVKRSSMAPFGKKKTELVFQVHLHSIEEWPHTAAPRPLVLAWERGSRHHGVTDASKPEPRGGSAVVEYEETLVVPCTLAQVPLEPRPPS